MFKSLERGLLRWTSSCNAHESIKRYKFGGRQFGNMKQKLLKCSFLCPSILLLEIFPKEIVMIANNKK